ncbi:MAG: hypothetical protein ACOYMN_07090, partial [Roseimicrobium sp.]
MNSEQLLRWLPGLAACFFTVLTLSIKSQAEESEADTLPLPMWSNEHLDPNASYQLGGLLWPDGFQASDVIPLESSDLLAANDETKEESRASRFLLFVPKFPHPLVSGSARTNATPPHAIQDVGDAFFENCATPDGDD